MLNRNLITQNRLCNGALVCTAVISYQISVSGGLPTYHTMTKPNFVVITHPKSETLANCLSKQDKTFLSQVNKYLAGENRVTSV